MKAIIAANGKGARQNSALAAKSVATVQVKAVWLSATGYCAEEEGDVSGAGRAGEGRVRRRGAPGRRATGPPHHPKQKKERIPPPQVKKRGRDNPGPGPPDPAARRYPEVEGGEISRRWP